LNRYSETTVSKALTLTARRSIDYCNKKSPLLEKQERSHSGNYIGIAAVPASLLPLRLAGERRISHLRSRHLNIAKLTPSIGQYLPPEDE
jgi:hypothetical protein